MFGIGSTELLVILVVALIVLGPKSLASVSRSLGKAMGEFRRVSTDFQRTLNMEAAQEEARSAAEKRAATAAKTAPEPESKQTQTAEASLPPDSPIAQAIAKARAEAEGPADSQNSGTPTTHGA